MKELRDLLAGVRRLRQADAPAVVATVVAVEGSAYRREGARLLIEPDGDLTGVVSGGCVERELAAPAREVIADGRARTVRFDLFAEEEAIWGFGLGCAGTVTLLLEPLAGCGEILERALATAIDLRRPVRLTTRFRTAGAAGESGLAVEHELVPIDAGESAAPAESAAGLLVETVLPPVHLVVAGAERDIVPLLRLAGELGWQATVVDPRPTAEAEARVSPFARHVGGPLRDLATRVTLDARTAVLVATHRYLDDLALLDELASSPIRYLGLLGPTQRRERLLADLAKRRGSEGAPPRAILRGPAGLDLGGRSPGEVALAIVAEIQAAFHGGTGRSLAEQGDVRRPVRRAETPA